MKIFSWVQNKLTSKKSNSNPANYHTRQSCKEEFSDWPDGLLAIGTFGKIKQESENADLQENFSSGQDHLHGLTLEEVGKLSKELNLIFREHVGQISANQEATNLPFDTFLDTNSSTEEEEEEERNCSACSDDSSNKNNHDLQCSTSLVHSRGKDICLDNSKAAIGKKSLSFLLKKMLVCRSGFSPTPSLRDPMLESRMEKMLKTLLHKKIYPQSSASPKLSAKNYLESSSSHIPKSANGNEKGEKAGDGSKWVKTDSEYIVLEI